MPDVLAPACILSSALISAIVTAIVRARSRRRGFVDRPGGHKAHRGEVALGGGIAIVAAVILPLAAVISGAHILARWPDVDVPSFVRVHLGGLVAKSSQGTGLIAGAIVLHIVGLLDDARPLPASVKFLVQAFVAAFLAVVLDLRVLAHVSYGASAGLTVLWIVTIVNAFNFLDNMDGLSSGVAIIVAAIYATVSAGTGQIFVPGCCWLLVGALIGFLPFNLNPATIYLGDAGSTVIGYLIAVFTILTTFVDPSQQGRPIGVLAPLIVLAVPLYDTASVILIRWRHGSPIWAADRRHFSHRLVKAGLSQRRAVLVIWLATFATALPAMLLPRADWPLAAAIVAQTLAVVALVALMESGSRE